MSGSISVLPYDKVQAEPVCIPLQVAFEDPDELMIAAINIGLILDVNWVFFVEILAATVSSKVLGCGVAASLMLRDSKKGLWIGYGMVARGEVAFITLGIGLAAGILNSETYSTLVIVILATIIISPTLLRMGARKNS